MSKKYKFEKWVSCPECAGTCKVWHLFKGGGFYGTVSCQNCILGRVSVDCTEEVYAELRKEALAEATG